MVMNIEDPRIRNLVRRAHKVASSGKRIAAIELYREILAEAPCTAEAWAGLGNILTDEAEQEIAYLKALEIDNTNQLAKVGLQALHNPSEVLSSPTTLKTEESVLPPQDSEQREEIETAAVCYRHPETETSLRCNRCAKPICIKCAQHTSVGYRCPDCLRELEAGYYSATIRDYLLAIIVTLPLSLLAGFIATRFGFFVIFIGAGIGTLLARIVFYVVGRRRGRYLPHTVVALVLLGGLVAVLFGSTLWAIIYMVTASSAAYYQLR